ncbi:amidohydrolase [Gulosibacter bifidus]|uniref:Amidohydrolase n=1 Tax=Gulosibacter bifidus TaxID=272239 RepID=A0ABW5RJ22_9MICO|nr:amidohydrolase [Gulosibacter bifidus]
MTSATVFTHARIYARVNQPPTSGGIAVQDGKVIAVGDLDHCRAAAGADAATVALSGAAVFPGFHDAHIHTGALALQFDAPDVSEATSLTEALALLARWADAHPGDGWVVGGRWDANEWGEGETLHRELLDEIFGDRPVVLNTVDAHSVCASSRALEIAGITADTEAAPGSVIERDADGQLNGILRENASDSIRAIANRQLLADAADLLAGVQRHLHARGITAITDFDGEEVRQGFTALAAAGKLRLRVRKGIPMGELDRAIAEGRTSGDGDDWLITGPVKLFSDGALGSHTALMHEGYEGDRCNCGVEVISVPNLTETVERANSNGIAVATHAIGDRANTNVLDAYEATKDCTRANDLHNSIEHAQHLAPRDIERFYELQVTASMQPIHCTGDFPLSVNLLGERDTLHYPWCTLRKAGVRVAFGSDGPIEPVEPMYGIHAAVTRQRRDNEPAGGREPSERLPLDQALLAYTEAPASMDEREAVRGRIEPGAYADFVALNADPYDTHPADLWKLGVTETIVAGEPVYRTEGAA